MGHWPGVREGGRDINLGHIFGEKGRDEHLNEVVSH